MVAGILLVLLAVGFIVAAMVFLLFRLSGQLRLRRLRTAPRLTCADVGAGGRLPRWALITGTTAPGPAGLLRSAAYDMPCIWFSTDVIRADDESVPADETRSTEARTVLKRSAGGPIALTDRSGTVLLTIKLVLHGSAKSALVRRRGEEAGLSRARATNQRSDQESSSASSLASDPGVRPDPGPGSSMDPRSGLNQGSGLSPGSGLSHLQTTGLLPRSAYGLLGRRRLNLREEFIEPGLPVTVLGRPRRTAHGSIVLGRPGAVSTDPPDAWIENLAAEVRSDAMMLRLFPLGILLATVGAALVTVSVYTS